MAFRLYAFPRVGVGLRFDQQTDNDIDGRESAPCVWTFKLRALSLPTPHFQEHRLVRQQGEHQVSGLKAATRKPSNQDEVQTATTSPFPEDVRM